MSQPALRQSTDVGDGWSRLAALVWLAFMLGALAIGAFGSASWRAGLAEDGPGCPFRRATSIKCAFCGLTHATIALGHGDVRAAFAFHPLAPVVLALMIIACIAIAAGRGAVLSAGHRPYWILGGIAAIWIVNLL